MNDYIDIHPGCIGPPLSLEVEPSSSFGCIQTARASGILSVSRKKHGVAHEDAASYLGDRWVKAPAPTDARQSRHRGAACASIERRPRSRAALSPRSQPKADRRCAH